MRIKATSHLIGLALAAMLLAVTAQAQTLTRVYASEKTGNDANTCDLTAPCKTLSGAHSKVVDGGEIICLDSGNYTDSSNPLVISKSVSIIAPDGVDALITLSAAGNGIYINTSTASVVIRGLTLTNTATSGDTYGIKVDAAAAVQIEKCSISGFNSSTNSHGVYFNVGSNAELSVKDTTVRNNNVGIALNSTSSTTTYKATLDRVRAENNTNGIWAKNNASLNVRDSIAAGNTSGFRATAGTTGRTAEMNLENCLAVGNTYGVHSGGTAGATATVRISNVSSVDNGTGLYRAAGTSNIYTRGNNTAEGHTTLGSTNGTISAQ